MMNKKTLMTVAVTVATLAAIYRVEPARELLTGDTKFLGIF